MSFNLKTRSRSQYFWPSLKKNKLPFHHQPVALSFYVLPGVCHSLLEARVCTFRKIIVVIHFLLLEMLLLLLLLKIRFKLTCKRINFPYTSHFARLTRLSWPSKTPSKSIIQQLETKEKSLRIYIPRFKATYKFSDNSRVSIVLRSYPKKSYPKKCTCAHMDMENLLRCLCTEVIRRKVIQVCER